MADPAGSDRRAHLRGPHRYAYGRYTGGADPLAPPVDLRAAVDRLGQEVMEGSSPSQALQELLRQGIDGRTGLDELTRQLWERRRDLQRRTNFDGTLQEVRRLLERALEAERTALQPQAGDDARFREMQLDALPSDTGGAVRELSAYDWQSAEARQAYQDIQDLLGRELLEQRFSGMKEALQQATPQDVARIKDMLSDLNQLLEHHRDGQDTTAEFERFMQQHGEFFPEQPSSTDELVDILAERSAAAQRLMNSMTPEQRAELAALTEQAFGDPQLAAQLAELDAQLQGLRPGGDWDGRSRVRGKGADPMGLGEATRALQELGRLDALAEQLGQSYPGARLDDIDLDALREALGSQASADARALADLERELRGQGLLTRAPDGSLMLSPKALRRLGEAALADVVESLGSRAGQRQTRRSGATGEPTGASRPWAHGDTEAWDVPRTLLNATVRRAGGDTRPLDVTDVEVVDTERRTRAAVALCVDTSWSMVQEGRWVPMKRTALALHHLVSTRFRNDELALITFGRTAEEVELGNLVALEGAWMQGTNLHHALLLAGRHLRRFPDATPVVLVVTDGEPTAHLESDGTPHFSYPPDPRTIAATVEEIDRLTGRSAAFTFFVLGEDPRLVAFLDTLARRCGGRVVAPSLDGLSAEVVADYLRTRR
ncbi:vWA domain-containing protein [Nakamurella leprariae]|uniref:VWA domain-containing protein n=1 Tax=Nakamurella leprariae TaxID=2803911 RepID=A0A939BY90_9ACTN|nr:VWA domain-containing protein [Nakamurella leprariae]MBM9466361.1 VWA domain-containing protein [Nakamurella leprariae]